MILRVPTGCPDVEARGICFGLFYESIITEGDKKRPRGMRGLLENRFAIRVVRPWTAPRAR